jgi:hypothetical protein
VSYTGDQQLLSRIDAHCLHSPFCFNASGKLVIDPTKLRPVFKLGGNVYGRLTELFEISRPDKFGKFPAFQTRAEAQDEKDRIF